MRRVKRKGLMIVFIVILVIIIILAIIFGSSKPKNELNEVSNNNDSNNQIRATDPINPSYVIKSNSTENGESQSFTLSELQSRNEFFCIEEIIDNFILQINSKNTRELTKIIDNSYISKNSITEDNVMQIFSSYDTSYYLIDKVLSINENNFIVKFRDKSSVGNENYIITNDHEVLVKFDKDTQSYSIVPDFDESNFESTILISNSIKRNESNGYEIKEISNTEVGEYFLELFVNSYNNNINYAVDTLKEDETNSINTTDKLKDYMSSITINYENIKVETESSTRYVIYQVTDGNNNKFRFNVYPNYIDFSTRIQNETTSVDYTNIYSNYSGNVSNETISNFMDTLVSSTVSKINTETVGLSDNKIREYYDENTSEVNSMGIYNAEDFVNLSNQIVGMRWSKGITYTGATIDGKTEENGYVKYNLKLSYTLDEEIDLYLCVAKSSNTTPQVKIETTGVPDNDDDTYTD